jgi:hypothetical protein
MLPYTHHKYSKRGDDTIINITARMKYSKKLQAFIEDNKAKELSAIRNLLIGFLNSGRIDYAGSKGQLDQNGRNGSLLQLSVSVDKCEFLEPDEVISYLRANFGQEWTNIINKLEEEKNPIPENLTPSSLESVAPRSIEALD